MKLNLNKEMSSWLSVLNNNFKWAVSLAIRILSIMGIIILIILFLKWAGLLKYLKDVSGEDDKVIGITPGEISNVSKPSKGTHGKSLKKLSDVINMLKNLEETKKEKKEEKNEEKK